MLHNNAILFLKNLFIFFRGFSIAPYDAWGTQRCSWLRHCAVNLKVAGSITDVFIGLAALWPWVPLSP